MTEHRPPQERRRIRLYRELQRWLSILEHMGVDDIEYDTPTSEDDEFTDMDQ